MKFVKSSLNAFCKSNLLQKHNVFVQGPDFQPASNFVYLCFYAHLCGDDKGRSLLLCTYNPYYRDFLTLKVIILTQIFLALKIIIETGDDAEVVDQLDESSIFLRNQHKK